MSTRHDALGTRAPRSSDETMKRPNWKIVALGLVVALVAVAGCNYDGPPDPRSSLQPRIQPFFDSPGTRDGNDRNRLPSEFLVEQIDEAKTSVHVCIYGFSKQNVIDALIRAYDRGVEVHVAGDAGHLLRHATGYEQLLARHIPVQVGNEFHIMHNKFFVIDHRFVWVGTGNITTTGFGRNNNNWVYIDSLPVAHDFEDEFNQMFHGRFSSAKKRIDNGNKYQVGDTNIEVYFSPQEDTMGVMLSEIAKAHTNAFFQIFAFTKDEVGSEFINKSREFKRKNKQLVDAGKLDADWESQPAIDWPNKVIGILDRSQLHGNGQYHEGYRMQAFGVPLRLEGNEHSYTPGDYQAGGGRLHTKTMILDYGTPDERVLTGSFNWSSSATISNDEVLMVLRGHRVVERYMRAWKEIYDTSRSIDGGMCYYMNGGPDGTERPACSKDIGPGDVVFSEVHWDGWNGQPDPTDHRGDPRNDQTDDEFLELYNTTDKTINLGMWTVTNGYDFKVGFTPGTVIKPHEYFLVLDHNLVPYSEGDPQSGHEAFLNPDFVLNMANDPRFPRLNLKNAQLQLDLRDATGEIIDRAGNGTPPFYGGRKVMGQDGQGNPIVHDFSMERKIGADGSVPDGTKKSSWKPCTAQQGGDNVAPDYRDFIIATPGQPNSGN